MTRLGKMTLGEPLAMADGSVHPQFVRRFNATIDNLVQQINDLATTFATATAAQTASKVTNSYTAPTAVLSAADAGTNATVTIIAHTRYYADTAGTSVAVNGGTVPGLAYSTTYYLYYDDPTLAGGAVTYQATTDPGVAAQTGTRLSVGSVTTPASGGSSTSGGGPRPPGSGGAIP